MDWLRLYTDVIEDRRFHQMPGDLFRTWAFLLVLTRKHGGALPPLEDIAFGLRYSEADAVADIAALCEYGLLDHADDGSLTPHNWPNRQYDSDSSTERVRKHRAAKQAVSDETLPERSDETPRNVSVTVQNRTDTDTDSEQIQTPPKPPTPTEPPTMPAAPASERPQPAVDLRKPKERDKSWVENHPLFPPLVALFGRPAGTQWGALALDIKALVEFGASADDVSRRAENYRAHMGADASGKPILLTRPALVKHWHLCAEQPARASPNGRKPDIYDNIRGAFDILDGMKANGRYDVPPGDGSPVYDVAPSRPIAGGGGGGDDALPRCIDRVDSG